ncbi:hypothetical protein GW746_01510, partial [Candidatus Saccharibacteria bacterium]|nr:hypothetical protein [Candidatus Saccharibacteria bacterium]
MKVKFRKYMAWFAVFVLVFQTVLVLPAKADTFPELLSGASDEIKADMISTDSLTTSTDGRYTVFAGPAMDITNRATESYVIDNTTGKITEVSVSSDGVEGSGAAGYGSTTYSVISADGRYVIFLSYATNLVRLDLSGGYTQIFIHDLQTGDTSLVSASSNGVPANAGSNMPVISADGRYVAFRSNASNLVTGDTNSSPDVFLHDRQTSQTTRVSVSSNGGQANGDWRSLYSYAPSISADGRYVAFLSTAKNLVSGVTQLTQNIYVHDCRTGKTALVSVAYDGAEQNVTSFSSYISSDGRYVAFESNSTNLIPGGTDGSRYTFVTQNPLFSTIYNLPPRANQGPNQTIAVGSTVALDGSNSSDPERDYPLIYDWSFVSVPQGSTTVINNPNSVYPTFIPDTKGNYVVSLTVTDSLGLSSQPVTLTVTALNVLSLSDANLWFGIQNNTDQGAKFDIRTELYLNSNLISVGQYGCVADFSKDKSLAKEVSVPFSAAPLGLDLKPGDTLTLKTLARVGTNREGLICGEIAATSGLRLYFDGTTAPSEFGIGMNFNPITNYFLSFTKGNYLLNDESPDGNLRHVDSVAINYENGNPWRDVGSW